MRYLIALLALAGLIDSALALRIHLQDPSQAPPCAVTETWDCGAVNHSRFAEFPPRMFDEADNSKKVHIPVAALGIVGYALIAVLALTNHLWATLQAAEIGFAFAAFLSFMEAYVLQKWCIYCVWSQAIVTAILVATIGTLVVQHRRAKRRVTQPDPVPVA
jgi:vitamin-K-epoxide reductase (warfarin-sensitive)